MTLEVLEAFLSKNKVYLKEPEKLMELREKAFGTLVDEKLFLSPYETFYLVEKRRARVADEKTGKEKPSRTSSQNSQLANQPYGPSI